MNNLPYLPMKKIFDFTNPLDNLETTIYLFDNFYNFKLAFLEEILKEFKKKSGFYIS